MSASNITSRRKGIKFKRSSPESKKLFNAFDTHDCFGKVTSFPLVGEGNLAAIWNGSAPGSSWRPAACPAAAGDESRQKEGCQRPARMKKGR